MLKLTLELYIWKQHIENKAKQRWYYNYLPKPVTYGFTLAEILITLTIIGVLAALTIPSLVNNINNATNVVQLKKTYSTLQQAFNLIAIDAGGSILDSDLSSTTDDSSEDRKAMNAFATKLNVVKNCGSGKGCLYDSSLKHLGSGALTANLDSSWNNHYGKAILTDGTMITVNIYNSSCTSTQGSAGSPLSGSVCGDMHIDVNGVSGPNQMGRDFFAFWITKTGIYPRGIFNDENTCIITSSV